MTDISNDTDDDEPDILGAAPTLDVTRQRKRRRARTRRRDRSPARHAPTDSPGTEALPDNYSGIEYVYEPHSKIRQPLIPYLKALWERRAFLVALAESNLRSGRSSTTLGGIWGIIDPLFQASLYYFLFTTIRGSGGRPDGFLFVLIATMLLFQLSLGSLNEGSGAIRSGTSLLLNSTFPRALLPLSVVYKGLLKFIPAAVVIVVAQIALPSVYSRHLLWIPLLFVIQIVGAIGFALSLSTLTVYFRDASNVVGYVARLMFFTTPVIIPLSLLEEFEHILVFQPLYSLFANYQHAFFGDPIDGALLGISALWAFGLLILGSWSFLRHERDFASRL